MKGDRVEIIIDVGGSVQHFEIIATRAGRRVEVTSGRGTIEVTEVTRSGQPVRSGRFMATRVVAIVEHPAEVSAATNPADRSLRRRTASQSDDSAQRLL
jgi:hypothetical protein